MIRSAPPSALATLTPTLTMAGRLSRCVLLSYRTPAERVRGLLPDGLELVRRGPWAFWNVVVCRVESMRPAGVPNFPGVGVSYHHVAYRLLVQAMTDRADVRRGLYFVRSDADAAVLGAVGNRLSDFRFHHAAVDWPTGCESGEEQLRVTTHDGHADAELVFDGNVPATHPTDSCFPTRADARAFLKYEPLGLSAAGRTLKLAEVFRDESAWNEDVVRVTHARFGFFDRLGQDDLTLELATRVAPLDYRWRLGRRERLMWTSEPVGTEAEAAPQTAVA